MGRKYKNTFDASEDLGDVAYEIMGEFTIHPETALCNLVLIGYSASDIEIRRRRVAFALNTGQLNASVNHALNAGRQAGAIAPGTDTSEDIEDI